MTSKRANRYPPELRERAVRMLLEQRSEYQCATTILDVLLKGLAL